MRVAIREQLAALVVFAVLVALAIVSVPTWLYVSKFVTNVATDGLTLTASLKAARISSEIELFQTTCQTISTRILIQTALLSYYGGNLSDSDWDRARDDLESAVGDNGFTALLQGRVYPNYTVGVAESLFNVTGPISEPIRLPYLTPNGSEVFLSDTEYGYPPQLYPNITYTQVPNPAQPGTNMTIARPFPDVRLSSNGGLLLGPLVVNASLALISLTVPIRDNRDRNRILGFMTVVCAADSLVAVTLSREGLGQTGQVLLVGPDTTWNRFGRSNPASNSTYVPPDLGAFGKVGVRLLLPPIPADASNDRHTDRVFEKGSYDAPFPMSQYPAVMTSFSTRVNTVNNASAVLDTYNEQSMPIAVGFARPQTSLVNWTVLVEQARYEAFITTTVLRQILLGCTFGTAALVLLLIFPCAHLSVMPIRRLKEATEKSIAPPGYEDGAEEYDDPSNPGSRSVSHASDKGLWAFVLRMFGKKPKVLRPETEHESRRRVFKIPGKVDDRKHFITDELTELTTTFNEMTDELYRQYSSLDEKVAERTRELEISKKAAEAANESKTLFIANISHELKTPLNGILGMCAVCMEEDDIQRIKQSLKTLYKSGDLLLHLLEDLLSFSKNQIGSQLSLEEREFRLGDVRLQILTIFDKQVREGKINFSVNFVNTGETVDFNNSAGRRSTDNPKLPAIGPQGTGRLKDMCLWGDQHRILQVLINLVSNSLKFTPPGGKVAVRIRCIGEAPSGDGESRTSSMSNYRTGRARNRVGSGSQYSASSKGAPSPGGSQYKGGTALAINPMDPKAGAAVRVRERSPTPPPAAARPFIFEFEVEDTGPGIPEHMLERVFEPFVQGDLGLSKKFGGTGLGLSICQQLANMMGGTITLTSQVKVGTTFTMRIPIKYVKDRASSTASSSLKSRPHSVGSADGDGQRNPLSKGSGETTANGVLDQQPRLVGLSLPFFATNPAPDSAQRAQEQLAAIDRAMAEKNGGGRLRVLVADDNSTNIEVVSRMLKLEDVYDVTIAKDGQEAYDLVKANMEKNQRFDVIFMDIQMPNLDGLQSTRLIRKMGYKSPIVALTAFSEESNVKECMESGMDEFLSKPIRRPALKQVLKKFATIPEEPEKESLTRRSTPGHTPREEKTEAMATAMPSPPLPPAGSENGEAQHVEGARPEDIFRVEDEKAAAAATTTSSPPMMNGTNHNPA